MSRKEKYSYKSPRFLFLWEPMRDVMRAYGEAERYFAAIKEIAWAERGFKALAGYIHALEHIQPEAVDNFKEIFAEQGLIVEYPPIGEIDLQGMEDVSYMLETCVDIIDNTDEALRGLISAIDDGHPELSAMARSVENLLMQNSKERKFLLDAWGMWEQSTSETSYDSWIAKNAPYIKE